MRKHVVRFFVVVTMLFTYAVPTHGQVTGSLSLGLGVPTGEFKQNIDRSGYGPSAYLGVESPKGLVSVGLDVSLLFFGRSSQSIPLAGRAAVEATTSSNVLQPHLAVRLQPPEWIIRPYIKGLFGFKYLYTTTSLRDPLNDPLETFGRSFNSGDFTLSGGGAAGLQVRVVQGGASSGAVYLNLGVQYLLGGEADYLKISDSFDPDNPEVQRSTTTMLIPMLGVTLYM